LVNIFALSPDPSPADTAYLKDVFLAVKGYKNERGIKGVSGNII
jgi:hypothetical protein